MRADFKGRVVLVTGAASGIGRALCLRLGGEGAVLGLCDYNPEGLERLREELESAGVRCATAVADVRKREHVQEAVRSLADRLGPIDVLVASAGVVGVSSVEDLKVAQVEAIMQVNFFGVVYAIEAVLPAMLQRGSGQIVGIASLAALRAIPFEGAYCASKAAVASYLEGLRPPLRRRGVAVTTVFPGFVHTPLLTGLLAATGASAPPGTVDVGRAARTITEAIRRRHRICCFPRSTSLLAHASRWLPAAVYDRLMTRIAARVPMPY